MNRIMIAGPVVAIALFATACSSEDTKAEPRFPAPSAAPAGTMPVAGVGDTLTTECMSTNPCAASFTITDITASGTCVGRFDNYDDGIDQLDDGKMYVSMTGEFEVASSNNGWTMMHDPKAIDGDGFTISAAKALYCHADEPHSDWSDTVDVGQKARLFGAWVVPDDATHLLLMDHQVEIPERTAAPDDTTPTSEDSSPSAAPQPTVTEDAPVPAPTVEAPAVSPPVGFTGAPNGEPQPLPGKVIDYCMDDPMYQPGTTMFTDGTTGFTTECYQG